MICCDVLLRFTTVTLRPCNVLLLQTSTLWCFTTVTLRPLQCFNTVTLQPCNVLLLRLFNPVMFYYYNKWTTCHNVTLWPNQPMAVAFCPILIFISVRFLPLAWYFRHLTGLLHKVFWPLKDCSIRFFSLRDCSMRLVGTVTIVPPNRTPPTHGSARHVP
jgi:hypothetical protein